MKYRLLLSPYQEYQRFQRKKKTEEFRSTEKEQRKTGMISMAYRKNFPI